MVHSNISELWFDSMQAWRMDLFLIPTVFFTVVTLVVDPVLLACIFCSRALRQETRYLLLANTLAADVLFLGLNLAIVVCNARGVAMPRVVCELVTAASVTAYCCAVLTVTLMVVDTYVAVRWPLHYNNLLRPARTHKIMAGLWAMAAMYPLSLLVVMGVLQELDTPPPAVCLALISMGSLGMEMMMSMHMYFVVGSVLCTFLILYCYARLYVVTKTSGIWQSRYSRARVTLLAHGVMLLLYFVPALVFTVELGLFEEMGLDAAVWINVVNMCVLMLLPRTYAPYLYGLRYRELYDTLQLLLWKRRRLRQVTVA